MVDDSAQNIYKLRDSAIAAQAVLKITWEFSSTDSSMELS